MQDRAGLLAGQLQCGLSSEPFETIWGNARGTVIARGSGQSVNGGDTSIHQVSARVRANALHQGKVTVPVTAHVAQVGESAPQACLPRWSPVRDGWCP